MRVLEAHVGDFISLFDLRKLVGVEDLDAAFVATGAREHSLVIGHESALVQFLLDALDIQVETSLLFRMMLQVQPVEQCLLPLRVLLQG